ncbi:Predicted Zn-dependent protease, minimal metalloprotease (MMP)-like domain [Jannaschia faecimaris]|uniref:Predicted Zn-dependent protease, minimal metalloprotease (MMP)-like domain n=1 Tax=Jannaschia faecimaris TaxID=1244108 RepID=A0A1H3QDK1_9RHOB|nr:metallopeptidase family protein [Jannaschia faecimaris]SDZ11644.1 Predicted Zn-dependent protease, minimal metalloprotease (MMP)-like domain [Jannaschia faecimaris]
MIAPDLTAFERIAKDARAAFPAPFAGLAAEVRIVVDDWPDDALLAEMQIESAYDLTGLYDGIALTERDPSQPEPPSTVYLFRRPILDEWADRGDISIAALIAHVTVHEFAHHFGWSDDDIARIDEWWT